MNNFLRNGRGLSYGQCVNDLSNHPTKENKRLLRQFFPRKGAGKDYEPKQIVLIIPMMIFCVLFSLAAVTPVFGQETDGLSRIKPLQIGDTISEELWNMPLEVVNHPEGKEVITLNHYRDKKLIILDFWATWCSNCISSMPQLKSTMDKLGQDIALLSVTSEGKQKVKRFIDSNEILKKLKPLSTTGLSLLDDYFPHSTIPHIVVIDNEGLVKSFTKPANLNTTNLSRAINYGTKDWDEKFDYRHPIFPITSDYVSSTHFYNVFSGAAAGLESRSGVYADSLRHTKRYFAWNLPFYKLLTLAAGRISIPLSQIRLNGDVDSNYFFNHVVTYEAVFPISFDRKRMESFLRNDIERYTGYTGHLQKQKIECWFVEKGNGTLKDEIDNMKHKITLRELSILINNSPTAIPIRVDDGIMNFKVDLDNTKSPLNFEGFRSFLNDYGLALRKEIREFDVLSVSYSSIQ